MYTPKRAPESVHELPDSFDWDPEAVLAYSPAPSEDSPREDDEDPGRWFVYSNLVAAQGA